MYEYLEGTLQALFPEAAVLDIGGIGYRIHISKTCSCRCAPQGQKLKLYVDLVIREDAHTLYGFATPQERDFFRLLQQVNGIGPKVALNILSHAPANELAMTVFHKDTKSLSSIPGIGKKLAERLVVELNERIEGFVAPGSGQSLNQEAVKALQTLGFSSTEARNAILATQKACPHLTSIEQIVQYALATKK